MKKAVRTSDSGELMFPTFGNLRAPSSGEYAYNAIPHVAAGDGNG
jgi:hypothetical protein